MKAANRPLESKTDLQLDRADEFWAHRMLEAQSKRDEIRKEREARRRAEKKHARERKAQGSP